MILTSFRSHTCTCPWRMFIYDTVAVSVYLKPTVINVSTHLFHPEIGNAVIPVIHVLIDPTHVRVETVASNDTVVCSHINTDSRCEQIPEPLNVISRLHPKKLVKAMELQGFGCRAIFNFTSESSVLGMRTMFSSASVTTLELL